MKFNTKILVRLALLSAMSIILGKFLQLPQINSVTRISFENLPLILAGYVYGPVAGLLCAVVADILGSIMRGYSIIPFVTVGAAVIGFCSGAFGKKGLFKKPSLMLSVASAHVLGSMIVKSIALYMALPQPWIDFLPRIPIYIVTGILEYMIIRFCLNHKGMRELL